MADLKTQLDKVLASLAKHFNEGTIREGMKECYTKDCKVMGPGYEKALEGNDNEEILKLWGKRKEHGGHNIKYYRDELLDLGDVAVERKHFEFTKTDHTTNVAGHVVHVWKKEDGNWKLYIVIYTDA